LLKRSNGTLSANSESVFAKTTMSGLTKIKKLQSEIQKNKKRIDTAMRMMPDGEIESSENKAIKSRYEDKNITLFKERASIDKVDFNAKIHGCFNLLTHLDKLYAESSVEVKQKIVVLNFPQKIDL
jgi:hypothetical protein